MFYDMALLSHFHHRQKIWMGIEFLQNIPEKVPVTVLVPVPVPVGVLCVVMA